MMFLFLFIILILLICIPVDNNISNNEIKQVNVIQEVQINNETEYMYVPVPNGKTMQIVLVPKDGKGE